MGNMDSLAYLIMQVLTVVLLVGRSVCHFL